MPRTSKWLLFWWGVVVLLVVLRPGEARAWIETTVLGDDIRLQVERNGGAVVEHQMTMRVRGSPMRVFALSGVDTWRGRCR
jgi:hypothetical protein